MASASSKVGILVIGQSPRAALEDEFRHVLPAHIEIQLSGSLDGLTREAIAALAPENPSDTLYAVLPDGSDVQLSHAAIARRVPAKLQQLANEGCQAVLFCCTGDFPGLHKQPCLLPAPILINTVCSIVRAGSLGVFAPLPEQVDTVRDRWSMAGVQRVNVVPLAPTASGDDIHQAARALAEYQPDYVVYDCMSYSHALRTQADAVLGRPSVLAVSLMARILAELTA